MQPAPVVCNDRSHIWSRVESRNLGRRRGSVVSERLVWRWCCSEPSMPHEASPPSWDPKKGDIVAGRVCSQGYFSACSPESQAGGCCGPSTLAEASHAVCSVTSCVFGRCPSPARGSGSSRTVPWLSPTCICWCAEGRRRYPRSLPERLFKTHLPPFLGEGLSCAVPWLSG